MNGGGSFVQEAGPTIALPQGAVVGPGAAANDLAVAFPVSNATDGVSLLVVDSAGVGTLHAASGAASAVRAPGEATNITLVSAPGGTWLLWANGSSNASSAEASSAWAADLGPGFSLAQTYRFRTEAGLSAGEVADATVLSDGSPLVLTSDAVPGGRALRSVPLFEPVPGPGSLLTLDWDGSSAAVHAAFGSVEYGNYSTIPPSTASAGRPTAPGTTGTSGAAGGAGAGTDTLNLRNTGTQSILTYDGASYAPSVLAPGQFLLAERDSTVEPVTIFNPTSVTLESVQLAFDPPPGWGVAPIASVTLPPRSQTTLPVVFQADDTSTPLPQGPGDIGILARWSAAGADLPLFVPLGRIPYTVPAATTPPVGGPVLSPWWLGGIGVAAALAALSLFGAAQVGALAGPLGGLYSRISRSEVLTHEVRAAIHDYARGHPGVRFEELRKTLGISAGSLSYHLRTLERQGYIRRSLDWARPRYYVTGNGSIVPVTQSAARTIEGALAGLPPQPLAAIARRIGISRQLARYHLRRMEAEGSIVTVSTSRRLRYALASPQDRSGRAPLASSAGGEPGSAPAGAMRAERTVSSAVPGAAAGAGARPDGSRPGS
jgi:DNA-binding MarR family transcriptional regulator